MDRLLIIAVLLACSSVSAQETQRFILAASRGGVIELIDPISLKTLARMQVELPSGGAGLNEISASADGSTIYVQGPIAGNPGGCCSLYSIDLGTLEIEETASIARGPAINSEPFKRMRNDRVHRSPDGHWLFGVRSFPVPRSISTTLFKETSFANWRLKVWKETGIPQVRGLEIDFIFTRPGVTARRRVCGRYGPTRPILGRASRLNRSCGPQAVTPVLSHRSKS
jgi:hypothetical protein